MKRLLPLLLCAVIIFGLAGCASGGTASIPSSSDTSSVEYTPVDINVGGIKGPTAIGMAALMEKAELKTAANNYSFTVSSAPDEVVGKIATGELDIAAVPTNLASTLYKKTESKVKVLAVNTYSVLSLLETGSSVNSFADLKGKTVYSTGEGSNPEYILRFLLEENGLDPDKDVDIRFLASNDELVAKMVSGSISLAVVPEPAASSVLNKSLLTRRVLNLGAEWDKVAPESSLMMGCVIVRAAFLEEHPEAVAKFLEEYKASVNAVADIDKAAELTVKYEIIASKEIALSAIPNCSIAYCDGSDMKTRLGGYLKVLFDANPKSIGGALPDDSFYYIP